MVEKGAVSAGIEERMPRPVLEGILAGGVTWVISGLCLVLLYHQGRKALESEVNVNLVRLAVTAAAFVDGDRHRAFVSPEQESDPAYREALVPLQRLLAARSDIRFLYTMVLHNGTPHIILDATPHGDADHDGVEDHSPIMQAYEGQAAELLDALRTGRAQADRCPVRDRRGNYFSGYAPIRDGKEDVAGVVGVYIRADEYLLRVGAMRYAFGAGVWVALGVCGLLGISVWRMRRGVWQSARVRRAAVESLRRSEAAYRTLVENTPDAVIRFNSRMEHVFVNPAAQVYEGLGVSDVIGKTHRELGRPDEECRFWEQHIKGVMDAGMVAEAERAFDLRDGPRTFNVRFFPERGEGGGTISAIAVCRDITEHRRSERDYRAIFDRMLDGFALHEILCDSQGVPVDYRFLTVNPAFERLTGLKAENLLGRTAKEVFPGIEAHWVKTYGRVALTGEAVHFENFSRDLNRHFEVTAYRPAPRQFACIFVDVSERKRMEEERQKVQMQLQQAQKLEGLGLLAGGIAHDFNNLLMAILGNADLALADLPPDSPVRDNVEEVKSVSLRAADLCRQMLAYSGRGRFVIELMDLSRLVADMEHLLRVSVSKGALLRFDLKPGLPVVKVDATQIRQIVMNFVINASEAIDEQTGVIAVSTGAMECDAKYLSTTYFGDPEKSGLYVYIEVSDTGCGMSEETQAKMFDPFFTTKFAGRGLGLAAVMGIVRGHHGAIKAISETAKGSTFRALFPVSEGAVPGEGVAGGRQTDWRGSGTALIVDDEETIRVLGKRMLEKMGFKVLMAADGREALDVFRARHRELACVIMDLTMPHMNGETALEEMRRIWEDVPIILSSGYNEQEITQRFAKKGMAAFLHKPYQMAELTETVRMAVQGRRAGDATHTSPAPSS